MLKETLEHLPSSNLANEVKKVEQEYEEKLSQEISKVAMEY